MNYTVKELAKLANVSIRTLHYYDEIGLLMPSFKKINGYRQYEETELLRLQQILFFRELDFPLEQIKRIIDSQEYKSVDVLKDQRKLLEMKKKRYEKLIRTIDKSIRSMKGGESMSDDAKFSAFNDSVYQKHKDEVKKRWGNTDAYKQSQERVGKMSKSELERLKLEAENINKTIAELMKKGFVHNGPEVQEQIGRFYTHLHHFYDPNYEMFKGLGQMYVSDPRFTKVYEDIAKGLAGFMSNAMKVYADKNLQK